MNDIYWQPMIVIETEIDIRLIIMKSEIFYELEKLLIVKQLIDYILIILIIKTDKSWKNEIIRIENLIDIELNILRIEKFLLNEIIIIEKGSELEIDIYEIDLSEFLKIMMSN